MLVAEFQQYFFGFSIFISSLFLVMLVLVQRGRGGGLTGALGGAGGQSAFGTKAGDLFTRITVGVAAVWIFLCAAAVFFLRDRALPQTGVDDRNIPAASGAVTPGDSLATETLTPDATGALPSDATGTLTPGDLPAVDPSLRDQAAPAPAATTPLQSADDEPVSDAGQTSEASSAATEADSAPAAEQPATPGATDSAPTEAGQAVPKEGE